MFVGDRLDSDIRGAGELGLVTVQALWFAADEARGRPEPDFMAFTPMDVLTRAPAASCCGLTCQDLNPAPNAPQSMNDT